MSRRKMISVCVFLVMVSVFAARLFSQAPTSTSPPQFNPGPITPYSEAAKLSSDVLRFRRGERYNSPNSPLPELGEQSDGTLVTEEVGNHYHDSMPFGYSDAVVVGTINSGQAYLTNDRRDIYSEFNVTVQEVLKTPNTPYIRSDDTLVIERNGGAVRLPSGKVLVRAYREYSMPLIGRRYLLFLKYNGANTDDYHLVTAYQLEGLHVYQLDDLEYSFADRQHSNLIHPLRERGSSEIQLLEQARNWKHQQGEK